MASVHLDGKTKGAWVAAYRPPSWRTGQKRGRKYLGVMTKKEATACAIEIEKICRAIDMRVATPAQLGRALELKLLNRHLAQSYGIVDQLPEPDPQTVTACYQAHPSTKREEASCQAEAVRHARDLERFIEWAHIEEQEDVTLDLVQDYLAHLIKQGLSWDTRRHRLVPLRRACQMGARLHGLADPLYKLQLDHKRRGVIRIEAFTLPELRRALRWRGRWTETIDGEGGKRRVERRWKMGNRERAVVLLGGFHGLRSSEIYRIQKGDLQGDVLQVGLRERKTAASRRDLPLAPTAVAIIEKLEKGKQAGELLIRPDPNQPRSKNSFRPATFGLWCNRWLPHAANRDLQAKHLRKAFGNIAIVKGVETRHIEAYLGHRSHQLSAVTTAHYIVAAQARELRPVAEKIEQWIKTGR